MKSAPFSLFGENLRPVWRFWELWRSKMRFGQNVLRTTWKERFVQFSWKAHCFSVLKRLWGEFHDFENFDSKKCGLAKLCCAWPKKKGFVQFSWKAHCFPFLERLWGQCDDFDNFDAHKFDLAKTCCAWPETSVWYNFHGKRTVWPFWREFQASVTNWQLWCSKMRFGQTVLRMTYNFHEKRTVFPFWKEFGTSVTILRSLTLTNLISPKRAAHDLKRAFCTIFMKSAPFFRFGENFRPVWLFWQLWRSKMRFGQNVLRMTWKEPFVQFSWKAHCFPFLDRMYGQCDDFENFDAHKRDLAKTCCVCPEKSVLYNFYGKRTVFPFWREFQASVTILTTLTLKNAIWPKRAAHDLKRAFCTIFMKSALCFHFEENLRQV